MLTINVAQETSTFFFSSMTTTYQLGYVNKWSLMVIYVYCCFILRSS